MAHYTDKLIKVRFPGFAHNKHPTFSSSQKKYKPQKGSEIKRGKKKVGK